VPDHGQPPAGIDASIATAARMYDYWLGGHDNFAADRIAALKLTEHAPDVPFLAKANRAFLGRAVRYLAGEAGIRQFLDLGTGLPTKGNVHQVAQAIALAARVVYVDNHHCKSGCAHGPAGRDRKRNAPAGTGWGVR